MIDISFHPRAVSSGARFSIVLPTWNNLPYLKKCLESLTKNSNHPHQIIVHVNEGSDGTLEWLPSQEIEYTASEKNVGICYAVNAAAQLAVTDYIVYFNDDMYACPGWDSALLQEIDQLGEEAFYISSTLIEPVDTNNPCLLFADYGATVETFQEEKLLSEFAALEFTDRQNPGGCATVVSRELWKRVGGYSIEFSPGWNSDPDFCMKLWHAGVRNFKTVSKSRVYHFQNKTGRRMTTQNEGRSRFRAKWNITSSKFMKHYMHLGEEFKGPLTEPDSSMDLAFSRLRARLPGIFG